MAALTADKDVQEKASGFSQRVGDFGGGAVDASEAFYKGALICFKQGTSEVTPGVTATDLIALGRCEDSFAAGAKDSVNVRCGIFKFENSAAGDLIANDDAGKLCYIVDDQTVALTDGGSTRSAAGKIYSVDTDGAVWVSINPLV